MLERFEFIINRIVRGCLLSADSEDHSLEMAEGCE